MSEGTDGATFMSLFSDSLALQHAFGNGLQHRRMFRRATALLSHNRTCVTSRPTQCSYTGGAGVPHKVPSLASKHTRTLSLSKEKNAQCPSRRK